MATTIGKARKPGETVRHTWSLPYGLLLRIKRAAAAEAEGGEPPNVSAWLQDAAEQKLRRQGVERGRGAG